MEENKETAVVKGDFRTFSPKEVNIDLTPNYKTNKISRKKAWLTAKTSCMLQHLTLIIVGLLTWGLLWCAWGENWAWNGKWFRLAIVPVIAWGSGLVLQELTTLPPLLAALLTGILARYLNYLDMRDYTDIDAFLRKIYPVVILGKGSLAWNLSYMKSNWKQVAALGVLPWTTEVCVLAMMTYAFLGFPWLWGFMLGTFYASVSIPVIIPLVLRHSQVAGQKRNWPQLICTAGGTDTALSVGVFGLLYSFLFYETNDTYRYAKAFSTLAVGVALGTCWGVVAGYLPRPENYYATELRILMVVVGALFGNFITSMYGWGGVVGVAVLVCNATAATFWARDGWKLNNNPASTAYRVFWAACEPTVFAYTGTFFVVDKTVSETTLLVGFGILAVCLVVRLLVVFLVCWDLNIKEKIFVCCTWIPKSIVEAVICPVALDTVLSTSNPDPLEKKYAEDIVKLIVQAILITTPLGFLLTNHLGPYLLKEPKKDLEHIENGHHKRKTPNGSQIE